VQVPFHPETFAILLNSFAHLLAPPPLETSLVVEFDKECPSSDTATPECLSVTWNLIGQNPGTNLVIDLIPTSPKKPLTPHSAASSPDMEAHKCVIAGIHFHGRNPPEFFLCLTSIYR